MKPLVNKPQSAKVVSCLSSEQTRRKLKHCICSNVVLACVIVNLQFTLAVQTLRFRSGFRRPVLENSFTCLLFCTLVLSTLVVILLISFSVQSRIWRPMPCKLSASNVMIIFSFVFCFQSKCAASIAPNHGKSICKKKRNEEKNCDGSKNYCLQY